MKAIRVVLILFIPTLLLINCKKDQSSTAIAVVTVLNEACNPVANATVQLLCPIDSLTCTLSGTKETDSEGMVKMYFKLPSILKVTAKYKENVEWRDPAQNCKKVIKVVIHYAKGLMELKLDETQTKTLIIKPDWTIPEDNPC